MDYEAAVLLAIAATSGVIVLMATEAFLIATKAVLRWIKKRRCVQEWLLYKRKKAPDFKARYEDWVVGTARSKRQQRKRLVTEAKKSAREGKTDAG